MDILLQVCIDVVVQRLGDATAAGMYKLLYSSLNGKTTVVSLYALPVRKITFDFLILFFQDFFLGVEGWDTYVLVTNPNLIRKKKLIADLTEYTRSCI